MVTLELTIEEAQMLQNIINAGASTIGAEVQRQGLAASKAAAVLLFNAHNIAEKLGEQVKEGAVTRTEVKEPKPAKEAKA